MDTISILILGITGFLDFVHRQVFWRTQSLGICICFRRQASGRETPTLWSPFEGDILNHWIGPNRIYVYRPLTWGRKPIQFPKLCDL
jgi:hypothetical protein